MTSTPSNRADAGPRGGALHVAAMPFPTEQGTQAAIHAMLQACAADGREARLLTYAAGSPLHDGGYAIDRIRALPGRESFRSGPSPRKVAQDALLALSLLRARRAPAPSLVVAHHVEAAAACLLAGVHPLVFFAHTALAPELPTYFHRRLEAALSRVGRSVDRVLCRRADAVAAVSPALARTIRGDTGVDATYVPLPWPVPAPCTQDERASARSSLGIDPHAEVLVYAGNLDRYQGWESMVGALALLGRQHPRAVLLVATASEPGPLLSLAGHLDVTARVRVVPLAGERSRRAVHAAADVAVVPRRATGGLPVKLLDALARGVPTVAVPKALGGLDLRAAAAVVDDERAESMASRVSALLAAPDAARELGLRARRYVIDEHSTPRFLSALDEVARRAAAIHR